MDNRRIIYIVIFLLVLAGLVFFFSRDYLRTWNTGTVQTNENYQSYNSTEYGVSFEYPEDYFLTERRDTMGAIYSVVLVEDNEFNRQIMSGQNEVPTESPIAITLEIFPKSNMNSLDRWLTTSTSSNYQLSPNPGSYSSTTVAGQLAVRYNWDGLYQGESVALFHKDNILVFSATYNSREDKTIKDFPSILSSLKLK